MKVRPPRLCSPVHRSQGAPSQPGLPPSFKSDLLPWPTRSFHSHGLSAEEVPAMRSRRHPCQSCVISVRSFLTIRLRRYSRRRLSHHEQHPAFLRLKTLRTRLMCRIRICRCPWSRTKLDGFGIRLPPTRGTFKVLLRVIRARSTVAPVVSPPPIGRIDVTRSAPV